MPRAEFILLLLACPLLAQKVDQTPPPATRYEEVVVTGVWEPVPLEEAERAVRSIDTTPRELTANSFADFLKLDSSLDLRQRAPNGVQGDLSIRGATFGQTLVLLDGIRINDAQSGHHNLDLPVPIEALSRVEVLKGTGSTQYGSDAIGGVVNFVTRTPEASEFRLRAAVGNFGVNQERGVVALVGARVVQQLYFSRDFSTGFAPNRDYRNLTLSSSTNYGTAAGVGALLLGYSDKPFGADRFYGNFNSWERTKTWFGGIRQALGEKTDASFSYRRHTDLFVLYRDQPERFTNRHALETVVGSVRRREPLGANVNLHYGAEGYGDRIESSNLGSHARGRAAGYVALDVRALRRFSFNAGLRTEWWGSANAELAPHLAAGAWLRPWLKAKGSVSRGFRVPSYTELYYQDPANRGSPHLRPERAWNYEAGLESNLARAWRAEVTVFQRHETDGIDFIRRSPAEIWRAANLARLRFTGIEAGAAKTISRRHFLDVRYTALRGTQQSLAGVTSRYVFNYPRHSGLVSWDAMLPRSLLLRTRLGALERLNRHPYALWDLYAARAGGRVQPFVQFTNLTAARYEEIPGVAMPGRAIVAGLQISVLKSKR